MKTVILTGKQGNQKALSNRIAEICEVSALVLSDNIPKKKPGLVTRAQILSNRIANRMVGRRLVDVWERLLADYDQRYAEFPNAPILRVENINSEAVVKLLESQSPDLIIVSGTNLIGKRIINLAERAKGIINLHTGISPYVKGGPNCTNWCLAKNWYHLIGSTVMWLDSGIDSGRIIATERAPLTGNETLLDLHQKVMEHAHDLYLRVIQKISGGEKLPSVRQDSIGGGNLFLTKDWNAWHMRSAVHNFDRRYRLFFQDIESVRRKSEDLQLVSMD